MSRIGGLLLGLLLFTGAIQARQLYVLTPGNKLVLLPDDTQPSDAYGPIFITGITIGQTVVGIDFNAKDGNLYCLGYNPADGSSQIYTVNLLSFYASPVSLQPVFMNLGDTGSVAIDFLPARQNQLLVCGGNGNKIVVDALTQNIVWQDSSRLRYDSTGAVTIGSLAATDNEFGSEGAPLRGYDNSSRHFFSWDRFSDSLVRSEDSLGFAVSPFQPVVFDNIREEGQDREYLAAAPLLASGAQLYAKDSLGAYQSLGYIGDSTLIVRDLAVRIVRSYPALVSGRLLTGLREQSRKIVYFDSEAPGLVRDELVLPDLVPGSVLAGIAYNPHDQLLYGAIYDSTIGTLGICRISQIDGSISYPGGLQFLNVIPRNPFAALAFDPRAPVVYASLGNGKLYRWSTLDYAPMPELEAIRDSSTGTLTVMQGIAFTNSYPFTTVSRLCGIRAGDPALGNIDPQALRFSQTAPLQELAGASDISFDLFYDSISRHDEEYYLVNRPDSALSELFVRREPGQQSLAPLGQSLLLHGLAVPHSFRNVKGHAAAIAEAADRGAIQVWPNPSDGKFSLRFGPLTGGACYTVCDAAGAQVLEGALSAGSGTLELNLGDRAAGIYLLKIIAADRVAQTRLVVMRH